MSRALKVIVWVVVIVVVAVGAAAAYFISTDTPLPWQEVETPDQILLVVASSDEAGSVLAQVVAVLDTQAGSIKTVSPELAVTIPGTTYTELKDAFPFGGGAGVAQVYADAAGAGQKVLSYMVVGADGVEALVDGSGGITVDLGEDVRVFDGESLYMLDAGSLELDGRMVLALLQGVPYLEMQERESIREQLAEALARTLATYPGGIGAAIEAGVVDTDLPRQALGGLDDALEAFDR